MPFFKKYSIFQLGNFGEGPPVSEGDPGVRPYDEVPRVPAGAQVVRQPHSHGRADAGLAKKNEKTFKFASVFKYRSFLPVHEGVAEAGYLRDVSPEDHQALKTNIFTF